MKNQNLSTLVFRNFPRGEFSNLDADDYAEELRDRVLVGGTYQFASGADLLLRGGAERIRNARYFGDRKDYAAEMAISLHH